MTFARWIRICLAILSNGDLTIRHKHKYKYKYRYKWRRIYLAILSNCEWSPAVSLASILTLRPGTKFSERMLSYFWLQFRNFVMFKYV